MRSALKYFLTSFLFVVVLSFFTGSVHAEYIPTNTNPDVPRNLNTYSQNVLLNVLTSFSCILTGTNPLDTENRCLGIDPTTKKVGYVESKGGALAGMGTLVGMTFNLPVHTSDYTNYLASNFGLVKTAYAQSPGYTGLQPLIFVWSAFRDFVYILFVLIFVIIGVAIMLRVKIDPRTVMTIQNQIPKIIIGLVLVTLSFAIAGLLIDLMWLITYLIISFFSSIGHGFSVDVPKLMESMGKDPFNFFQANYDLGDLWAITSSITVLIREVIGEMINAVTGGFGLGTLLGWILTPFIGLLVMIILPIVVFFVLFRLWFMLLQSFIMILINVIFAPFYILFGILPTKSAGFGGWIKSMLANLSVFPAVVLMFMLGKIFIDLIGSSSTAFIPPIMGDVGNPGVMKGLIALGVILLTPNIANMVKAAFKSPDLKLGSVFKPVISAARVPSQAAKQTYGAWHAKQQPYITGVNAATQMPRYENNSWRRSIMGTFLGGR